MTKRHLRIGKDPERLNRSFWDDDADDYQAAHEPQLDVPTIGWGVWDLPERDLNVLGDVSGQDVLEYGCGAAQFGIKLARTGARVTGLDQSRGQLRHAAKKVAAAGVPVRLVCATATAVPLPEASFDVVFCDHGAMSFCDPYRTVPEVARVLRAGRSLRVQHLHAAAQPLLSRRRPRRAGEPQAARQVLRRPGVRLG